MNQRLTRRRFGQVVIAGSAAAGLTYLANKTEAQTAQTANLPVVGVDTGSITSTNNAATPEVNITELDSTGAARTGAASTNQELVVESLDVVTGQVKDLTTPQLLQDGGTPILHSGEQVTGLTYLSDGRLVVAITPVSTSEKGDAPTRLTILGTSSTTVTVSGLNKQQKLESLVGTSQGGLLGLVVKKNGTPPVSLVDIDVKTGQISFTEKVILPSEQRFSNLAQCPDGKLYTTTVGKQGETNLVQLNLGQQKPITKAQLRFNGSPWNNGLNSLVCSKAGQLLALGARRYESPNNLYTVDPSNGIMTLLKPFDVARITIAPT